MHVSKKRCQQEAVVASACEGLGVAVSASGSTLWSCIEVLYSRAGERLREALHAGVKKALAVVSTHYVICQRFVRAMSSLMMRRRPRRSCRSLETPRIPQETLWPPSSTLKWSFPPSARGGLGSQGNKAFCN